MFQEADPSKTPSDTINYNLILQTKPQANYKNHKYLKEDKESYKEKYVRFKRNNMTRKRRPVYSINNDVSDINNNIIRGQTFKNKHIDKVKDGQIKSDENPIRSHLDTFKRAEFDSYVKGNNGIYRLKRNGGDVEEKNVRKYKRHGDFNEETITNDYDKTAEPTTNTHRNEVITEVVYTNDMRIKRQHDKTKKENKHEVYSKNDERTKTSTKMSMVSLRSSR